MSYPFLLSCDAKKPSSFPDHLYNSSNTLILSSFRCFRASFMDVITERKLEINTSRHIYWHKKHFLKYLYIKNHTSNTHSSTHKFVVNFNTWFQYMMCKQIISVVSWYKKHFLFKFSSFFLGLLGLLFILVILSSFFNIQNPYSLHGKQIIWM